ncbi:MAG: PilZ domain-containing protein [Nitrospira sp.]
MESRKSSRFAVQLPSSFSEAQRATNGTILNISREGCMVIADQVPAPPTYIRLDMQLWEGQEPVRVELAAVRWSSGTRFGLEYIKLMPEQRERLVSFMTMLERDALP